MSRSQKWVTLEISLRLRKTLSPSTLPSTETPLLVPNSPSVSAPPQPVADIAFTLGNLSDDILSDMEPDQLLKFVINTCDSIPLAPSPSIKFIAPCDLFSTPQSLLLTSPYISLTSKMDRVWYIALSGDVMTFTRYLNFLDLQDSFDIMFGDDPTMMSLIPRKKK